MPKYCAVCGFCYNSSSSNDEGKRVSLHRFPLKDVNILNTWLINMKQGHFKPTEYSRLCSSHFEEDCFEYQNFTNKRFLKKDAIPTIFAHKTAAKRKRTSYTSNLEEASCYAVSSLDQELDVEKTSHHVAEPASKSIDTQTEGLTDILIPMVSELNAEIAKLKSALEVAKHSVDNIKDDKTMFMLTGFSLLQFNIMFDFLNLKEEMDNAKQLFFLFMVRLKSGTTENFLSYMFDLSQTRISVHMISLTDIIYYKIKDISIWPSKETVKRHMPSIFKNHFPSCRVIIDSIEFKIQKPSNPAEQQITFSPYENCNTLKCMIGISPSGAISFISDLYGGSISDKELFLRSKILQLLESGDSVFADRGFLVEEEIKSMGCTLYSPLFLKDKIQINIVERRHNKKISRHRVHVKRAIWSIKKFKFFDGSIPIQSLHSIHKIVYIIAFFINFGNPLNKS